MEKPSLRKITLYIAIGLMIPTLIIALFFRQEYPVLGPVLAISGIIFLAIFSFLDNRSRKAK